MIFAIFMFLGSALAKTICVSEGPEESLYDVLNLPIELSDKGCNQRELSLYLNRQVGNLKTAQVESLLSSSLEAGQDNPFLVLPKQSLVHYIVHGNTTYEKSEDAFIVSDLFKEAGSKRTK